MGAEAQAYLWQDFDAGMYFGVDDLPELVVDEHAMAGLQEAIEREETHGPAARRVAALGCCNVPSCVWPGGVPTRNVTNEDNPGSGPQDPGDGRPGPPVPPRYPRWV